mmetsp:Transcript_28878/g.94000  ORF Transcript_28878/g.94000 Transcript_28878/m.94000 type:complete len:348 (+) Transcript_28878:891-1934(+)
MRGRGRGRGGGRVRGGRASGDQLRERGAGDRQPGARGVQLHAGLCAQGGCRGVGARAVGAGAAARGAAREAREAGQRAVPHHHVAHAVHGGRGGRVRGRGHQGARLAAGGPARRGAPVLGPVAVGHAPVADGVAGPGEAASGCRHDPIAAADDAAGGRGAAVAAGVGAGGLHDGRPRSGEHDGRAAQGAGAGHGRGRGGGVGDAPDHGGRRDDQPPHRAAALPALGLRAHRGQLHGHLTDAGVRVQRLGRGPPGRAGRQRVRGGGHGAAAHELQERVGASGAAHVPAARRRRQREPRAGGVRLSSTAVRALPAGHPLHGGQRVPVAPVRAPGPARPRCPLALPARLC